MSRQDGTDRYTYPDSEVLRNKADLRDQAALDAFEADTTAIRLLQLNECPIVGAFNLAHLQAIHHHLFQDIYDWAGELRTVDISKGDSRFGHWTMIASYLDRELGKISQENFLRDYAPETFIPQLAHYMGEINAAHPFREGNGRVQRTFCAQLAEQAGYFIDFAEISRDAMYSAMIASFRGNLQPLVSLLNSVTAIIEP